MADREIHKAQSKRPEMLLLGVGDVLLFLHVSLQRPDSVVVVSRVELKVLDVLLDVLDR